jgi:hypothetical protein
MTTLGLGYIHLASRQRPPTEPRPCELLPQARLDGSTVTIGNVQRLECRWPYGPASAALVLCGRHAASGPYCKGHRQMASGGKGGRL